MRTREKSFFVSLVFNKYFSSSNHDKVNEHEGYSVWAAIVHEVEVDVLTGELNIRRTDILEDTGTTISPEVDIGQVEGGYIMSLGMWLTERAKYNPETGR